jgi:hypothetical protein
MGLELSARWRMASYAPCQAAMCVPSSEMASMCIRAVVTLQSMLLIPTAMQSGTVMSICTPCLCAQSLVTTHSENIFSELTSRIKRFPALSFCTAISKCTEEGSIHIKNAVQ